MIKKTNPCISFVKYIRSKQILMALAAFLLILSAGALAAPGHANTEATSLQPITITGTVADQNNEPLPGVYVLIQGTNTGVVTDANGKFSIQVPNADASLVFSFIGFNSETIAVAGKSVVNVTLIPVITSLDEVVVIGYG